MKQVLTNRWLEGVGKSSKRISFTDQNEKNLMAFIEPTGKIYWKWQGRVDGVVRHVWLGQFPAMDVTKARRAAAKMTAARDEAKMRGETFEVPRIKTISRPAPAPTTTIKRPQPASGGKDLNWLWDEYLLRDGCRNKASTIESKQKMYNKDIKPKLGTKPYAEIIYDDLADIVAEKARTSPGAANNLVSYTKRLFKWAVTAGRPFTKLTINPAIDLMQPGEKKEGDRYLTDDEIVLFFKTADTLPGTAADGLTFLLYTGARLTEAFSMPWSEYDPETGYWDMTTPRIKNGDPLLLPLPPTLQEMLKARKAVCGKGTYVFPQRGKDKPVNGFSKRVTAFRVKMSEIATAQAGKEIEVPHWSPHDLRRTVETGMTARLDENDQALIAENVIDKVLNHRKEKVRRTYNKHKFLAEKRRALLIWAEHLDGLRAKARQPELKQAA